MPAGGNKFFIASFGAVGFDSNTIASQSLPGCYVCKVQEEAEAICFSAIHHPAMFSGCSEEEARESALKMAMNFFPESEGWTGHDVRLVEIPRSLLIQRQFFLSFREVWHRLLVLTGFRVDHRTIRDGSNDAKAS